MQDSGEQTGKHLHANLLISITSPQVCNDHKSANTLSSHVQNTFKNVCRLLGKNVTLWQEEKKSNIMPF